MQMTSLFLPEGKRWRVLPHDDDFFAVGCMTPRGTGRKAVSMVLLHKDLIGDRRMLAWSIRTARANASNWRQKQYRLVPKITGRKRTT
jgi:hypothetical protein